MNPPNSETNTNEEVKEESNEANWGTRVWICI